MFLLLSSYTLQAIGASFEDDCLQITWDAVVPQVASYGLPEGADLSQYAIYLIKGVTLKVARGEIDRMVVRVRKEDVERERAWNESDHCGDRGIPVDVVAIIESKRSLGDVGYAFRMKQELISFLCNDSYVPWSAYVARAAGSRERSCFTVTCLQHGV